MGLATAVEHRYLGLADGTRRYRLGASEEREQAHLAGAQARALGVRDLKADVSSYIVSARVFKAGTQDRLSILFSEHWLSAACMVLPDLYDLASRQLDNADISISVPNRGAMLVFPKGDAA